MKKSTPRKPHRHCVSEIYILLVFIPDTETRLEEVGLDVLFAVFSGICRKRGVELRDLAFRDGLVWILVKIPPTETVSGLVNALKGASSRVLRNRYETLFEAERLWNPSYFASSWGPNL